MWNGSGSQLQTKSKEGFEGYLDKCVAIAERAGKELIANRPSGVRATTPRTWRSCAIPLAQLTQRGIGFTVHALHHSLVADLHRDEWGPVGWPEWLHFIEADGSLRPGDEAFK
jgi:hypothetical protein